MVIIVSISIIVTILIRNRVMKQLGVTTVQLFLKVPSALSFAENLQSKVTDTLSERKKGFHCFCPDGTSGAPYATSQGCYDIDEDC